MKEICKIHGLTEHVQRSDRKSLSCKKCRVEAVKRRRIKIKRMAIEYKGGSCVKCGYNKCEASLEFHHLDPSQKSFGIAAKGYTRSWERVKKELDKCILICSNCHKELHWKETYTAE